MMKFVTALADNRPSRSYGVTLAQADPTSDTITAAMKILLRSTARPLVAGGNRAQAHEPAGQRQQQHRRRIARQRCAVTRAAGIMPRLVISACKRKRFLVFMLNLLHCLR